MPRRFFFAVCVSSTLFGSASSAADEKPAETPAGTATAPAGTTPAAPSSPAAAATPSAALQKFTALLGQRETLRAELEQLQLDYKNAPPADRAAIRAKFEELRRTRASALDGDTEAAARTLLVETKGEHERAADFLQSAAVRYAAQDRYERALALAQDIIAQKVRNPRLYELAGRCAFHCEQFDDAKKYFAEAARAGALDGEATQLQASLDSVSERWAAEKKIREAEAQADDLPRVELVTSRGPVLIELFENEAPQATANFISLVEKGFYNGLSFHRVLDGFMAQGGDPKGDGTGGPGYHIACECEQPNARLHFRGTLSMAHAGKDTGGSQFFLTFVRTPHLDGRHTAFGRVIEGIDNVAQLQRRDPGSQGKLPTPDKILEARVVRKREHAYEPKKLP